MEYPHTPIMRNEVINRTNLSGQGSAAKRKLLEFMITRHEEPRFGIEGYGPERAIYEAVIRANGLHAADESLRWQLKEPENEMAHVWYAMLGAIKDSRGRIVLTDVYKIAKNPPYGTRDGPLQLLVMVMILIHRDNIALYEHGTFVPRLRIEVAERMAKNPEYFELKYFKSTPTKKNLLKQVSLDLGMGSGGILDVISHLTRMISALPPHIKNTKNLDTKILAVRDALLVATEPDTLLFESLPKALEFKTPVPRTSVKKFSKDLAKSADILQHGFASMLDEIESQLFDATGINERGKLSRTAADMKPKVAERDTKVFLEALSADTLEGRDDWIKYVAMSLTDMPPDNWTDEHRDMFENNLRAASARFKRLVKMHFAKVSVNFPTSSYMVTITHEDGSEQHDVISLNLEQENRIRDIVALVKKEMGRGSMNKNNINALVAALIHEGE